MEVSLQLKNILVDLFDLEVTNLKDDTRLRDLGLDSMHIVDVSLEIESRFHIKFDLSAVPINPSLGEVISLIEKHLHLTSA